MRNEEDANEDALRRRSSSYQRKPASARWNDRARSIVLILIRQSVHYRICATKCLDQCLLVSLRGVKQRLAESGHEEGDIELAARGSRLDSARYFASDLSACHFSLKKSVITFETSNRSALEGTTRAPRHLTPRRASHRPLCAPSRLCPTASPRRRPRARDARPRRGGRQNCVRGPRSRERPHARFRAGRRAWASRSRSSAATS